MSAQQTTTYNLGDVPYPVAYEYDNFGRRTKMKSYRGGSGWGDDEWPTNTTGDADVTEWVYDTHSSRKRGQKPFGAG